MRSIGSAFFLLQACCVLAALAASPITSDDGDDLDDMPRIDGVPIISARARAARIAEFVSSHKIPDDVQRKDARLFERRRDDVDADEEEDEEGEDRAQQPQRRAHVDLENFGSTGLLYEDERRTSQRVRQYGGRQEEPLSGVRVSSENPTTMLPVLTTQRDTRPFDFVPVNIIREDGKGGASFLPWDNKNFEDLGDVNLVPAGSNTRIQVKKGPNGKDYEYEYVYYYYDEEDEGKASGSSVPAPASAPETPTRAQAAASSQRQRGNSNRNKYSTLERNNNNNNNNNVGSSSTAEPVINEVIPVAAGSGSRARQLESAARHEEVAEERLPTNTRFPPRARSNQAADPQPTERTNRGRGNRQRSSTAEPIDSSSFRGHQEGPEFPQNLPNGPVRFLGVTPNEGNEEKTTATTRGRARPSRIQEPAPVQEAYDEPVYARKRPVSAHHETQQSQLRQQPYLPRDEESATAAPAYSPNSSPRSNLHEERESYTDYATEVTDAPTTQVPSAMQKVALDLYAFLQQGRSNLVDFVKETDDESTETNDNLTTELAATTSYDDDATSAPPTTTPTTTTTTTATTTTTTTTTTAAPSPSTEEPSTPGFAGRPNKFRRPGVGGPAISRNRFKSGAAAVAAASPTTESSAEATSASPTQRARGRFGAANSAAPGAAGSPAFKRARPSVQKPAGEEPAAQKEDKANTESAKPAAGRGRYRGTSARAGAAQTAKTTAAPSGVHRPSGLNKLGGINRRRGGRPAAAAPAAATEEAAAPAEQSASSATPARENVEPQKTSPKIAIGGARPKAGLTKPIIKPGAGRLNNPRPRLGAPTSTTTAETPADAAPAEAAVEEPASEGTEEETRQAAAETSPATKATTANPLNKLRNRNRIQVHPKTTTARTTIAPAARRSPLLPRRKTTEAPVEAEPVTEAAEDEAADSTENQSPAVETSSAAPAKHEESRGLSSLLAPRRRISPRRPGQPIAPLSSSE